MASDTKNVRLGVCQITLGGVDLGYTKGGVEVEVSTETHKVMVDQFGNSEINEYVTGRTCAVTAPLAETTMENMVNIMPGATLTETGGAQASGTITFGANASDDDTVTIGGAVFTFKDSPVGTYDVAVGGTTADSLDNLLIVLNASDDLRVNRATYSEDGSALTVTYGTKSVDGNTFGIAASAATASGATLSGGVDSLRRVDVTNAVGVSLLDQAKELRLHPVANADSDVEDDFIIPLAATAGQVSFAYKLDEERVFNCSFTGYPDPNTKRLFYIGDQNA